MNGVLLWLILLFGFYLAYALGARNAKARAAAGSTVPPPLPSAGLNAMEERLAPLLEVTGRKATGSVFQFDGHLRTSLAGAFARLEQLVADEPVTPLLLEGEPNEVRVVILPGRGASRPVTPPRWWLHWMLLLATLVTTTWAGALQAGVNLLAQPERFAVGLPYSVGLLLILGAHELGHYFTAKAHGVLVTPPFFIPVPFALGTFGAFIKIKSITPNRRALFDVAVAGPLAGLVFAVPALLFGLRLSSVLPGGAPPGLGQGGVDPGSSIMLACLAKLSLGIQPGANQHLLLHPLAFAGWLGLIVTALNLLPIGQLDGGHISHALFGSGKSHGLSAAAMVCLFLLALFVWPGLMFWAFIVYFVAGTHDVPAADDLTPVDAPRRALGYLTFLLLLLIIVPVPHSFFEAIRLHSPYL